MGLLQRGMAFLGRVGAENESVTVTYSRPMVFSVKSVSAVIGGPGFSQEDNTDIPGRIGEEAIDFIIRLSDWTTAGCVSTPKEGDLVIHDSRRYRVIASNNIPAWDWGEPERLTYRIHARFEG